MREQKRSMSQRGIRFLTLIAVLTLTVVVWAQSNCFICGSTKSLRQIKVAKTTKQICHSCRSEKQRCDLCKRACTPEYLQDGRRICPNCKRTRILTQEQLDGLYDSVKGFLARDEAGVVVNFTLPVQLADKDEIQTKMIEGGRAMSVLGFYSPYNPEKIYILSGQTKLDTGATLVHEYTHGWQSRNCPTQDRALTEGFASYIEYRYFVSKGQKSRAMALTRKNDPDYGESLQKLLEMEQKVGVAGVVRYAKTEKALP